MNMHTKDIKERTKGNKYCAAVKGITLSRSRVSILTFSCIHPVQTYEVFPCRLSFNLSFNLLTDLMSLGTWKKFHPEATICLAVSLETTEVATLTLLVA